MCNRTDLLKRWQQSTKAIGGFSQSQPRVPLTAGRRSPCRPSLTPLFSPSPTHPVPRQNGHRGHDEQDGLWKLPVLRVDQGEDEQHGPEEEHHPRKSAQPH
jgi:hypothetical protein